MACRAQRCAIIYPAQGPCYQATPYVLRPRVHSMGKDGMACLTSSDRVCCRKAMMAFHARHRPTVCVALGQWHAILDVLQSCVVSKRGWWHATINVVRPCVFPKDHAIMPRPTSSNHVCCLRATITCHTRCHLTVCAIQGRCWHYMPDIVWPCVLRKDHDSMPCSTEYYHAWCLWAMMWCYARRLPTVFAKQGEM